MDFDYLFFEDLPKGIKTVCIKGKRLTIEEFEEAKEKFFKKRNR